MYFIWNQVVFKIHAFANITVCLGVEWTSEKIDYWQQECDVRDTTCSRQQRHDFENAVLKIFLELFIGLQLIALQNLIFYLLISIYSKNK